MIKNLSVKLFHLKNIYRLYILFLLLYLYIIIKRDYFIYQALHG